MTVVCSIGTTDPWNAAGLGLDIRALAELGARPVTVVAGVSAQGMDGLRALEPISPALVRAQLDALAEAAIDAYRIGALADRATLDVVAEHLSRARAPAVYDPVLAASGGGRFGDAGFGAALVARLAPLVTLLTPNAREACELLRMPEAGTGSDEAQLESARRLHAATGAAVLVTGGDRAGDPVDYFVDADGRAERFVSPRIGVSMRGTGCLLAAAAAVELARGATVRAAVEAGRAFVRRKLARASAFGAGFVAY